MDRILATFSLLSDTVAPDKITSILDFVPDHTVDKGCNRIPPRAVPKLFGWYVTCCSESVLDVETALKDLVNRIESIGLKLTALRLVDSNLKVLFSIAVTAPPDKVSFYLTKETLNRITLFGGELDVEYFEY